MLNVTKTFMPPIELYTSYIQKSWDNSWLTNRGPLVLELEDKLKNKLNINNIILMNNGTIPLQIALKIFIKPGDEIITTPFSYVATVSSIIWESGVPVFVDIKSTTFNIDENLIEEKITSKTKVILATHVFGNPCNVFEIEKIAKKYKLIVIYDAAHCFGVNYLNKSIFNYGDISTCSFHATKIFHTGEGGALFTNNLQIFNKAFYSHNFGHNGYENFHGLGINGKISELNAAMGLSVLPYFDKILESRIYSVNFYIENLNWHKLNRMLLTENTEWNYSYFPIIFESTEVLIKVLKVLNENYIYPRRYFYPSLNKINYINGITMPISEKIASTILCLPLFYGLKELEIKLICNLINSNI